MLAEYRQLRATEVDAAINLWTEVFESDRAPIEGEFLNNPRHIEQTHVAIASDGTLLSAVHDCHRSVRDRNGIAHQTGFIAHVGTREEAQHQGHASQLLDLTIDAMRQDECLWSILWGKPAARSLYQRHGWQPFPATYRQGVPSEERPTPTSAYVINIYDPWVEANGWQPLATVYDAFNATRPLTVVRDLAYWQQYVAPRWKWSWNTSQPTILVAKHDTATGQICGYIIGRFFGGGFNIDEIGVMPSDEAVLPMLLASMIDEAVKRECALGGRVLLPQIPPIDSALDLLFGQSLHEWSGGGRMARPISQKIDAQQIDALFSLPDAIMWDIDAL